MSETTKARIGNLTLLGATLALCFLFAEYVVFRHILIPDDVLQNASANGVVRYVPGTKARFRHPDGRSSVVTINHHGWNATRQYYKLSPPPGRTRIAVVGDSYVHGAFVNPDEGFPEVLERELNNRGTQAVEVLRFGMDGAPLSQYLHMLRQEVLPYRPDVVVVQLIHNDFDESFRFLKTRYASSFMKVARNNDGSVAEVPPEPFKPGLADTLRNFATFRYLYYETNLYLKARSFVSKYFWGGDEVYEPEFISSAVDIRKLKDMDSIAFFTLHIMEKMKALSEEHNFKLVFAMDGVREAIYAKKSPDDYVVGKLNRIASNTAANLDLPFIDLQDAFRKHYARHMQRFEHSYDWHWNALGNKIVGKRIADALLANPGLLARSTTQASFGAWVNETASQ